ncbi:MAG: UDP-N-acetylmuramate dehydrogenase [Ruminococcus sp.]|nr:UDP-N-acetylmuramate dehydrogenase [Ruminococcus sp.]
MDNSAITIYNLAEILGCEAKLNEPMKKHTTFRIGGEAEAYIKVSNLSRLSAILKECKSTGAEYTLIGKGSNVLVDDNGIKGAVIKLDGEFNNITFLDDTTIYCGAGATLASLCKVALNNNLTGLEFAWGIPGSVGGAVYMNAGAYGGEMKDVIVSVNHMTRNGAIGRIEGEDLKLGYRTSVYRSNDCIITGVTLKLKKGLKNDIQAKMDDYIGRRASKQPLEFPSAGSVFKRPEGAFAGSLIEQCGLKGKKIGGAEVSEKHAGFIINKGNATADDVKKLIKEIQNTVKSEIGYDLECELIML